MSPNGEVETARRTPPVPGALRLAWLLFMQPLQLRRLFEAWGWERHPTFWPLLSRLSQGDRTARALVGRLMILLVLGAPLAVGLNGGILWLAGVPIDWSQFAFGLVIGGVFFGAPAGVIGGAVFGVAIGVAVGVAFGVAFGVTFGVIGGVVLGMVLGVTVSVIGNVAVRVIFGSFGGVAVRVVLASVGSLIGLLVVGVGISVGFGVQKGMFGDLVGGMAFGAACCVAYCLAVPRLITYPVEAVAAWRVSRAVQRESIDLEKIARWLPYRWHDLIYLPLPGIRTFLVTAGVREPALGQKLIAEAAETIGQKKPAREALIELEARNLEEGVRNRSYEHLIELELPFLPGKSEAEKQAGVFPFVDVARDLRAASLAQNHLHQERALKRARRRLIDVQETIVGMLEPDRRLKRRLQTLRIWLEVVAEEEARLAREVAENPQVPTPFIAGPALGQVNEELFKGRRDLARILDHDLAGDRRAPLLLFGQRRMGKSSFLNMLPVFLGSGTQVVTLNFQSLSGEPDRETPYLWIPRAVHVASRDLPAFEGGENWGAVLNWLRSVEKQLHERDLRLLIALDEVERLEDGIRAGWTNTDLLDLIRASGDSLHRIRFLLVSAHPLHRLGPHWVDRLISVLSREIRYLDEPDARSLICEPIPDFPDIYPDGGVERIVGETHGHPYLIQLVCDHLCKRLNEKKRLKADMDDLDAAFDLAVLETPLFHDLWRDRTDEEKEVLRKLTFGDEPPDELRRSLRELEKQVYVIQRGDRWTVTVPLFQAWIEDRLA